MAECVKDAGEEGGAKREGARPVAWLVKPVTWGPFGWLADPLVSGIRDAGTMRFPPFCEPKQENAPKHPPHLFLCQCKSRNIDLLYDDDGKIGQLQTFTSQIYLI
jgi:hypothetical protein